MVEFFRTAAGSPDMNVKANVTPVEFQIRIPSGRCLLLYRITISITENAACNADKFGAIGGGLTNGCLLKIYNPSGGVVRDMLRGTTLKYNGDFSAFMSGQVDTGNSRGVGGAWNVSEVTGGRPICVPSGYMIRWTIRDDLTKILRFRSTAQGVLTGNENLPR